MNSSPHVASTREYWGDSGDSGRFASNIVPLLVEPRTSVAAEE